MRNHGAGLRPRKREIWCRDREEDRKEESGAGKKEEGRASVKEALGGSELECIFYLLMFYSHRVGERGRGGDRERKAEGEREKCKHLQLQNYISVHLLDLTFIHLLMA